jgi:hypothetical protein
MNNVLKQLYSLDARKVQVREDSEENVVAHLKRTEAVHSYLLASLFLDKTL